MQRNSEGLITSQNKILIGSPVYKRAWVLPLWFERIENQDVPLERLGFVFEMAPDDDETLDVLLAWHAKHPEVWCFDLRHNTKVPHQEHRNGRRSWSRDRYEHMSILRNSLLSRVRVYQPDRYFSLDTDVLLDDTSTISSLYNLTEYVADAAAPLMYMTPVGNGHPSVMTWMSAEPGGIARRLSYPIGECFQADVIMAAKMMNRAVYNAVNYQYHRQGEDLGWSARCAELGFKLYSLSGIYAPHIMSEQMLEDYLENGDIRISVS